MKGKAIINVVIFFLIIVGYIWLMIQTISTSGILTMVITGGFFAGLFVIVPSIFVIYSSWKAYATGALSLRRTVNLQFWAAILATVGIIAFFPILYAYQHEELGAFFRAMSVTGVFSLVSLILIVTSMFTYAAAAREIKT